MARLAPLPLLALLALLGGAAPAQTSVVDDLFARARDAESHRAPERAAALARRALAAARYTEDEAQRKLQEDAIRTLLRRVDPLAASAASAVAEAAAGLLTAAEELRTSGWNRLALALALAARRLHPEAAASVLAPLRRDLPAAGGHEDRRWGDPVPGTEALAGKEGDLARLFHDAIGPDPYFQSWAVAPAELGSPPGRVATILSRTAVTPVRIRLDLALGDCTVAGLILGARSPAEYYRVAVQRDAAGVRSLVVTRCRDLRATAIAGVGPLADGDQTWLRLEIALTKAGLTASVGRDSLTTRAVTLGAVAGASLGFQAVGEEGAATGARFRGLVVEER
jgi:hypothetical protein